MKIPEKHRSRPTDAAFRPMVLKDEHLQYHPAASGLERPVVMWDTTVEVAPGHHPGEHDGIRDGYAPPQRVFRRIDCSLAEWLEAGNPDPRAEA